MRLLLMAYAGIWITDLAMIIWIPVIGTWFSLSPEALQIAIRLMREYCVVGMILWPSSFTLPNALRAGGDARFTMMVSMVSMWLFRVLLCCVFVLHMGMGVYGVWYGMYTDWVFRSLLFHLRLRSGKWMEHRII